MTRTPGPVAKAVAHSAASARRWAGSAAARSDGGAVVDEDVLLDAGGEGPVGGVGGAVDEAAEGVEGGVGGEPDGVGAGRGGLVVHGVLPSAVSGHPSGPKGVPEGVCDAVRERGRSAWVEG